MLILLLLIGGKVFEILVVWVVHMLIPPHWSVHADILMLIKIMIRVAWDVGGANPSPSPGFGSGLGPGRPGVR
jgi:hypothetical protein